MEDLGKYTRRTELYKLSAEEQTEKMKLVMNVHCQAGKNYMPFSAQNYLSSVSLVKSDLEENCESCI